MYCFIAYGCALSEVYLKAAFKITSQLQYVFILTLLFSFSVPNVKRKLGLCQKVASTAICNNVG